MRPDENKKRHIVVCGKGSGGGSTTVDWDDIQNKPNFATVANTGDYDDLTDKPTILTQWFGTQAEYDAITVKDPNTVYNIEGSDNVQADWNQSDSTADDYIKNKPTIPAAQVNSDWNSASGVSEILNKPVIPSETETLTFTLQGGTVVTLEVYVKSDDSPYFYVENINNTDITFDIVDDNYDPSNPFDLDIFGSTDQENWSLIGNTTSGSMTATVPANGRLYIKANTDSWYQTESYKGIKFNIYDYVNVGGNIMSLLYGDDYKGKKVFPSGSDNNFYNLFNNCSIVSAEDLILPATTLADFCYGNMFTGCTSLTTAPVLPATILADNCYDSMFQNCTALVTAPALPATTLANYCYGAMFYGTAITEAPALPATTLAEGCYSQMFYSCTNLFTAPELPATTLAQECYSCMFSDCTNLFTAPELPATTLALMCYIAMFYNCTSLTTAPELPATTLAEQCYYSMFNGCTNLNSVTTYAQDISATVCLDNWLDGVSATGDFYNLGGATYPTDSASGIPSGWTEHTSL